MLLKRISVLTVFVAFQANAEVKIASQAIMSADPMPDTSAMLEVESTDKGLLLPRVALTSTTSASPLSSHVAGMEVYNTATTGDVVPCTYHNDGTKWVSQCSSYLGTEWYKLSGGSRVDAENDKRTSISREGDVGLNLRRVVDFKAKEELEIFDGNPGILLHDSTGASYNTGLFVADYSRAGWGIHSDNSGQILNLAFVNYRPYTTPAAAGFKWYSPKPTTVDWEPLDFTKTDVGLTNFGSKMGTRSNLVMHLLSDGNLTIMGSLTQSSDERLKKEITPFEGALNKIEQIEPVYFRRKSDVDNEYDREIGFTAQNVEEVLPELVTTSDDTGLKSVAYANMTPILVKAVQELNEELQLMKAQNLKMLEEMQALRLKNHELLVTH